MPDIGLLTGPAAEEGIMRKRWWALLAAVVLGLAGVAVGAPAPAGAADTGVAGELLVVTCANDDIWAEGVECGWDRVDAGTMEKDEIAGMDTRACCLRRSPGANIVAGLGLEPGEDVLGLRVFDSDGSVLQVVHPDEGFELETQLAWDPTGRYVVFGEKNGSLARLLTVDVVSGAVEEIGSWASEATGPAISSIDWSPDGSTIALSGGAESENTPIGLWTVDLGTGAVVQRRATHTGTVRWSHDGTSLASDECVGSGPTDYRVLMWDASFGGEPAVLQSEPDIGECLEGGSPPQRGFAWHPDDDRLATWHIEMDAEWEPVWRLQVVDLSGIVLHDRDLTSAVALAGCMPPTWAPDGSGVAVLGWPGLAVLPADLSTVDFVDLTVPEKPFSYSFWTWLLPEDPAPPVDHLALSVSNGYSADADLAGGNLRVVKNSSGVVSVTGSGTFPGRNTATASMSVSLNRLWILPLWLGNVRVNDGAYHFDGLMLFPSVSPTQTGAAVNGSWLQHTSFPWGMGSLGLTVADRS